MYPIFDVLMHGVNLRINIESKGAFDHFFFINTISCLKYGLNQHLKVADFQTHVFRKKIKDTVSSHSFEDTKEIYQKFW